MDIVVKVGKGRGKRKALRACIEGPMTIYDAARGKAALLQTLQRAPLIELDLSGVGEMDTAGAQLLVLLKREAAAAGKRVLLSAHSPAVLDVFDCYGLAPLFVDVAPATEGQAQTDKQEGRA